MLRRLGWWLVAALLVTSCGRGQPSGSTVHCPEAEGSRPVVGISKKLPGVGCTVGPEELTLNGIRQDMALDDALRLLGRPLQVTPVPDAESDVRTEYLFSGGVRLRAREGRVVLVEISGGAVPWDAPRGIRFGDACSRILVRFGPSHDGAGTYYYVAPGGLQLTFSCVGGQVEQVMIHK